MNSICTQVPHPKQWRAGDAHKSFLVAAGFDSTMLPPNALPKALLAFLNDPRPKTFGMAGKVGYLCAEESRSVLLNFLNSVDLKPRTLGFLLEPGMESFYFNCPSGRDFLEATLPVSIRIYHESGRPLRKAIRTLADVLDGKPLAFE